MGEAAKPARVILFGSYARGDAGDASDLDFLVVEPTLQDKFHEMVRLRQVLRPLNVPVDVWSVHKQRLTSSNMPAPLQFIGHCVKARFYMTRYSDIARRLLALARRDRRSFRPLASHPEVDISATGFFV